ncbi:hypothetical protein ACHAXA_000529 [Cyclostephanos tholiformis]|uniref:Uncharacterized protein n=1 Tax=Cyclostephanos tholiformis TaxID=382380 RepID=A0ABD3STC5_9STRA
MGRIFVILWVLRTLPPSVDAVEASHSSLPSSGSRPLPGSGFGNHAIDSITAHVMNEIRNNQASARSAFASSSPECWMASINAVNQLSIGTDPSDGGDYQNHLTTSLGSSFCASMTVAQHDILALELTNCQLMRANLPFYDSNVIREGPDQMEVEGCLVGTGGLSPYDASSCFRLMSPYSFNLYNTFLFHTKELCSTLSEERTMMRKEEVTLQLLRASSAVSRQMEEAALAIEETASRAAAMMQEHTENMIREQREELQKIDIARRQGEHDSMRAAASTIEQTANLAASIMQEHTEKIVIDQREGLRREQESIRAAASDIEQMANRTASILQAQTESIMTKHEALEAALQKREREAATAVERMKTETASLISEQARHTASMMKELTEKIMMEQREELRRMNVARKQEEQDRAAAEARTREESIRAADSRLQEVSNLVRRAW